MLDTTVFVKSFVMSVTLIMFGILPESCYGQSGVNPAAAKPVDNYTVQYLLIFNKKNELLMMKNDLGWHTLAVRSNKPQSIKETMDSLAGSLGIKINQLKIAGVYTHKFEGLPDHPEVSLRTHYTARLIENESSESLKNGIKSGLPGIEYKWVPKQEALSKLHFDFLRLQTEPILKKPEKVWGGTFLIVWEDGILKSTRVVEPIYPL